MIRQFLVAAAIAGAIASGTAAADETTSKVLGSIHIAAGQHTGDLSTVNGSIHVDDNAVVGQATTVNGSITLGSHASAQGVNTVNGSVHVGNDTHLNGHVSLVNGSINLAPGADVSGDLTNVNGSIRVQAAHVGGGIHTTSGGIDIGPNARVDGVVVVEKDESWFNFIDFSRPPLVVIGPGSVVKGPLTFKREVRLYVSDRASIGPVQGATPSKFSGDRPPE
jgi:cytoskeletal protein CcmA (bactofilin family)